MLKCVGVIEASATERFVVDDEFVARKNGIKYVDPSFMQRFGGIVVAARGSRTLVCDMAEFDIANSAAAIEALKSEGRRKTTLADILAILRHNILNKEARHVCFVGRYAVRIDWHNGWVLHAFSIKAPGEWQRSRRFISRMP